MNRYIILVMIAVFGVCVTEAQNGGTNIYFQTPYRHIVSNPVLPDSCDLSRLEHKAFWRALTEESAGAAISRVEALMAMERKVEAENAEKAQMIMDLISSQK